MFDFYLGINYPQSVVGVSYYVPTAQERRRLCRDCLHPSDKWDVLIYQVPPRVEDRPTCVRCDQPLGVTP